ncbi:DUF4350 domain-containing protein [Streptomyces sp. SID8366]|uniref:DUF4350 domain-containing protein n=1 Tax=unclassified Streptomyces TaxID=2593676 RepID=UPI000DBA71D4|nr:DUF4350 domain-containing protein [Streptomyces sp. PsTaAH-130]MYU03069.1 DUF4350 domain-containing protein [Streptomyces sp. SID8366]MYU68142.1 DUF4350 domain-containing protein [Streptomyces sp. SID69]RAJ56977.1 uncharacterized protein DUF4350 [Streptomyces sp. PsTaAH-130]
MTTEAAAPNAATSTAPTARTVWTRTRGIVLAVVLLLAAAVAMAAVRSTERHGRLDPRSADPYGSRAVAQLLADRGVTTRVVTTLSAARAAAGPDTTLLVAVPDRLTDGQQSELHRATAHSGGRTVLVAASGWSIGRLAPGVSADPADSLGSALAPACALPEARRAGTADTGGVRYTTTRLDADSCYPSARLATLLRVPAASGGDTVVLGAPDILYNDRLDQRGNASLALQLLGSRPHLVWYLPSLSDAPAAGDDKSFFDLIPSGWTWATLQLFIAAVLAAFWRGRRFGPLVPERLPVVIRASETAEGRARLYRKAAARDRAAAALRSAARTRLAPLVGVPVAQAHTPEALLPALSAHLTGDGRDMRPLLFGPPPGDDTALIALTDQLDALEREVRRS